MPNRTEIIATITVEGMHLHQGAAHAQAFLAVKHRHQFVIRAYKPVADGLAMDPVAFGQGLREWMTARYGGSGTGARYMRFGNRSCAKIAEEILDEFGLSKCCVMEDGENGAVVDYQRSRA